MVVMTHNTDISDTWEREGENQEYFDRFSPDGYAVGVNIIALRDDALRSDAVAPSVTEVVEAEGHLIDSQLMNAMFDTVVRHDAAFDVLEFRIGRTNDEPSFVSMRVTSKTPAALTEVPRGTGVARLPRRAAPRTRTSCRADRDGCAPDDFYSTTNHQTSVRIDGQWVPVDHQRMDAAIVIEGGRAVVPEAARDPRRRRSRLRHPRHQDRARVPGARPARLRVHDERDLVRAPRRDRRGAHRRDDARGEGGRRTHRLRRRPGRRAHRRRRRTSAI